MNMKLKTLSFPLRNFCDFTNYKAANNVAFICKHFYTLTVIKKLNFDCHLSNQDDSNTYTFINNKTKD